MKHPLILLSPSKGMSNERQPVPSTAHSCAFPEITTAVAKAVQQLPSDEARSLFKVSEALWPAVEKIWSENSGSFVNVSSGLQGLTAYNGEAFKFLNSAELTAEGKANALRSLYVMSALYGVVSSAMYIVPYRLEMQSRLQVAAHKNLYNLWRPILTQWVNATDASFVLDACSGEYSKAIDWKNVGHPYVQIDFKQMKNGQLKSVSAFSKQARGAFVRWCLENNIKNMEALTSFSEMGYRMHTFDDNKLVFLRDSQ